MEYVKIAVTLFIIMDPFGNTPVISSILSTQPAERHRKILIRECLFALILFITFLFIGESVLNFLDLDEASIRIAGGVVLFIIALGMLFPAKSVLFETPDDEPFIVPIAMPLIAGPSMLAMLMLLSRQHSDNPAAIFGAMGGAWLVSSSIILCSPFLIKILGRKGLRATERLMGMVLIMISVQMLLNGITAYINDHFLVTT